MPSSRSTIEGLIERLESLLNPRDGLAASTPFLNSGVGSVIGGLLSGDESKGAIGFLSNGVLGSSAGLVAGLLRSLFGGRPSAEPALPSYEPPSSLFLEYDVSAAARPAGSSSAAGAIAADAVAASASLSQDKPAPPAVIVQVNALDAQSFSARSDDIASAVREALARNHALRDEIWED